MKHMGTQGTYRPIVNQDVIRFVWTGNGDKPIGAVSPKDNPQGSDALQDPEP